MLPSGNKLDYLIEIVAHFMKKLTKGSVKEHGGGSKAAREGISNR